jgi:hypothetical protein
VNDVFQYLLAVAARRFGIKLHAYCVLSNHFHLVLTDPLATLPAFHQFLDALLARAINASLGRWEAFWAPSSYSAVALASAEDIVAKAAYVLANPVAAGLVRSGSSWPGLWSGPDAIGGRGLEVQRPKHFFDAKGSLPEKETLELTAPQAFESAAAFREQVAAELAAREEQAARDHRGRFMGVVRILAQSWAAKPRTGEPRRELNPRVASRDKWKRIEVLGRLVEFLRAYRVAWAARSAGDSDVLFPSGTYLLRVVHGVPCAGFG